VTQKSVSAPVPRADSDVATPEKPRSPIKQVKTSSRRSVKNLAGRKRKAPSRKRRLARKRRASKLSKTKVEQPNSNALELNRLYQQGYQEGLNEGGERLLTEFLPTDRIIPDISAREAVAAGVEILKSRGIPLLDSTAVFEELDAAIREKRPFSFIRLGDGELLTLAQESVLSVDEVRRVGSFLPYAGVIVPNLKARDELASCIQAASLVGVPLSRHPHFQPLLFAGFRAHGIDFGKLRLTTSTMNYTLEEHGLLARLLEGRKILIIGDTAMKLQRTLLDKGLQVVGIVTPVNGYSDVQRVLEEAMHYDYDIALVSAGVPAVPISVHLAGMGGKVTIDFGHLADRMAGHA